MAVIMSLEPVAKRRFARRRNLQARLKLSYPSEYEMQRLARLANIDDSNVDDFSIFAGHIRSLILDAHLNDLLFREFSATQIRTTLDDISKKARQLGTVLKAIDVGSGGSAEHAGQLLEWELSKFGFNKRPMFLPEYIAVLGKLNDAAKGGSSSVKTKRGQRNIAFNQFVEGLLMAAEQRRGHWTIYRAADDEWTGTLLEALTILQQYLPQFFPTGEVGRSVEYVRSRLEKHITKNEGS
jgi:hypothetical protein